MRINVHLKASDWQFGVVSIFFIDVTCTSFILNDKGGDSNMQLSRHLGSNFGSFCLG